MNEYTHLISENSAGIANFTRIATIFGLDFKTPLFRSPARGVHSQWAVRVGEKGLGGGGGARPRHVQGGGRRQAPRFSLAALTRWGPEARALDARPGLLRETAHVGVGGRAGAGEPPDTKAGSRGGAAASGPRW